MLLSKFRNHRHIFFAFSLILCLTAGLYFTNTIIDLIHFLSIPLLLSYILIFNPSIIKRKIVSSCVICILIILLTAGYLIVFAQSVAYVKINLLEVPLAVYFLVSVYVILWSLDKLLNLPLQIIPDTAAKNIIKNCLRFACLIFIAIPYLVATFSTHWIKFSGTNSMENLPAVEYQHVFFTTNDGTRLDGWYIPATFNESDSSVIIAPGRTVTKKLLLPYAKVLCDNGYNVFLFDQRGNGDSSGHRYSFGINETEDIVGAADYLQINMPKSSKYIFGLGINEGAVALVGAAEKDKRFAGIVVDNTSGYEISMPGWLSEYLPAWMEKTQLKITNAIISMAIGHSTWDTEDIYDKISQISPCPVLIANSMKTDKSSLQQTINLYARAKEPKMLWQLTPQVPGEYSINFIQQEYFENILKLLDLGKTKREQFHVQNKPVSTSAVQQAM